MKPNSPSVSPRMVKSGQNESLAIRNGSFDNLAINKSNTSGIPDHHNHDHILVERFKESSASPDKAVQAPPTTTYTPPILRLPTELRAKIFHYLLPNKEIAIEPSTPIKARKQAQQERDDRFLSRVRARAVAQHEFVNDLLQHSNFYGTWDESVHSTRYRVPFEVESFEIPMDFSVGTFGGVYDMAEDEEDIVWAPSLPAAAGAKESPFANLGEEYTSALGTSSEIDEQQTTTFIDPPSAEEIAQLNEALHTEQYDTVPTNMTLDLMTTCSLFAEEISTIIYEEYTFEINVHPSGIDFLDLPRLATYEYFGDELAEQMTHFEARGHFCLQRMRHLTFVLVGGDVESRTGMWRMRKHVQDIVAMLGQLATLQIDMVGAHEFWNRGNNVRFGTDLYSVVEIVCAPFARGLRGVGEFGLVLPEGLGEVDQLIEWSDWLGECVTGSEEEKDGEWDVREAAMFEATLGWEYRKAFRYEPEHELEEDYGEMDLDMEDEEEYQGEDGDYDGDEMDYEDDSTGEDF